MADFTINQFAGLDRPVATVITERLNGMVTELIHKHLSSDVVLAKKLHIS